MTSEVSLKVAMFYTLMGIQTSDLDFHKLVLLLTMIASSSALTIGFVLGQASLDKYLHSIVEVVDREDQKLKKEIERLKSKEANDESNI